MILSSQEQVDHCIEDQLFSRVRQSILPPKEIITKNYEPDKKPVLKLKDARESILSHLSAQMATDEKMGSYKNKVNFREDDSLGYYYTKDIKMNLKYVKFDNRRFFQSPENKCKYLAGFFISLNNLLKPEIKIHKSLYKALKQTENFPFAGYEDSIENSFKDNCLSKDTQVKFSSNYESSNLFIAFKTGQNQYDLILQNDINSRGTTQWFNFAVEFPDIATYKFNIVNLTKSHSLFQKGMQIPYFSFQSNLIHNTGWMKGCQNITYSKSQIYREGKSQNYYFKLGFEYENKLKDDVVIFSYSYPYTGLDMERFFGKITQRKISTNLSIEKIKISETLSGMPVFVYRIYPKKSISSLHNLHRSHLNLLDNKFHRTDLLNPKGIVFLARQHPGQSQSSFILEGIIDFLLENNEYQNTKKNFHYYIFPMVNVDGVYYGNYRTNLSGNDLNRVWKQPRKDFHPEIYSIKKYLYNANRLTEIKLIVDIHGHSSAMNSFFYGNPIKKQGCVQLLGQNPKLFPYFCSKQMKEINFLQCTFNLSEDKKGSARVVLNEMFPKASVYTFQNSFFGYKKGKKIVEYTVEKYKKIGRKLLASYFEYSKITDRVPLIKQKWEKQIEVIYSNMKNNNIQEAAQDSDSQAQQQLLQFQNEYNAIDNLRRQSNDRENQGFGRKNILGDKFSKIQHRLYERKKQKTQNNCREEEIKKYDMNGIHLQDNPTNTSETNFAKQLGFLSIVKIETKTETKTNEIERNDNLSNQNSFKEIVVNQSKERSSSGKQPKTTLNKANNLISNTEKLFKKQYTVRSIRQQNLRFKDTREIQYIDEKEFLMNKRKLLNHSNKFSLSQLPNLEGDDKFQISGKKASAPVSRPPEKQNDPRFYYNG